MRANPVNNSRINIITLGCAKNTYDSEILITHLSRNSINVVHEAPIEKNDIVVVNTCGFINEAKQESINNILEFARLKESGDIKGVVVIGCLSERYKEELRNEMPNIDKYFGLDYLKGILQYLNVDFTKDLIGERVLTTPKHYAYLKISDGCNQKCSFCAIPLIKGKYKSQSIESICLEAEKLCSNGVKELIIIAQDTTYYGLDLYQNRKLSELLRRLSNIEEVEWIRLQYTYPVDYLNEIINVIKEIPKICNYLDIPFQHISDNMLKVMRRGITKAQTFRMIEKIRAKIPNITIRTTLIVGHPGESNRDFEELVNFVKEIKFDRLGVFTYSHEEGTHSYKYEDDVSNKVKNERADIIMNLQKEISQSLNSEKINKVYKVIIDKKENDYYVGRTEFDTPEVDNEVIIYSKEKDISIGEFYQIRITKATEYDLIGEVV